jgi:hypothetical protein
MSGCYQMVGASRDEIERFGRFGLIRISHEDSSNSAIAYLHGGKDGSGNESFDHADSLRLADDWMHELVGLLRREGEARVVISADNAQDAYSFVPAAMRRAGESALDKLAKMLPLSIAAIPGLMPASAAAEAATCYDSGTNYSSVDFNTILTLAGGDVLSAYVPSSTSGVTLAGGLDLGIYTSANLTSMGFNSSIVSAWAPYLATITTKIIIIPTRPPREIKETVVVPLVGSAASAALSAHPLKITAGAAQSIDGVYYPWAANQLASSYNAEVAAYNVLKGVTFSSLPMRYQTGMVAMYLTNTSFQSSSAFVLFAQGKWASATAAMRSYGNSNVAINKLAHVYADYIGNSKVPAF